MASSYVVSIIEYHGFLAFLALGWEKIYLAFICCQLKKPEQPNYYVNY